jgi:uncharacterized protein (DUF1697 family)
VTFVAFLRGINVGGNRKFSPAALAKSLAALDVTNIGAAGTFVIRNAKSAAAVVTAIASKLPFVAEIAVVSGKEIAKMVDATPFPATPDGTDVRRMVAVLTRTPTRRPRLPLRRPDGDDWQIDLVKVSGPFALYFWRPDRARMLYTDVIDRELGTSATSRSWNTIEKIRKLLPLA